MSVPQATTRPILPSADLGATAEFYVLLGFAQVGLWPEEYLTVRDAHDIELHFWHDPRVSRWTNDVACWVGFTTPNDVQALYDAWAAVDLPQPADLRPPSAEGHLLEFQLIDPHGNLVRVGAPRATTS